MASSLSRPARALGLCGQAPLHRLGNFDWIALKWTAGFIGSDDRGFVFCGSLLSVSKNGKIPRIYG